MLLRISAAATLSLLVCASAGATTRCDQVLKKIGKDLADVTCFESTDLTTNNPHDDAANNSIAGLPAFAFTPQTDRGVIAPSAAKRPPITKVGAGRADPGAHRLRPDGPGALPAAAARRLERPPGRRRRVRHAQRVQRRFRVERLRRAEGLCLRVAEQGRAQPVSSRPAADPLALPAQSGVAAVRALLRQRAGPALHALGRVHGQGGASSRSDGVKSALRQAGRATPTRWARPTAATRCAARSRRRRSCSTAASTGKARSSTRQRPTS